MDLNRLEQIARSLKTRAELEQLKENALSRGEIEAAKLVSGILLERFPIRARAVSGRTPTEARLLNRTEFFESGKEAYLWLVEQVCLHQPRALEKYLELQSRAKSRAKGNRFAKATVDLFPPGSSRVTKDSHHASLSGGWFADVNLDHKDKFATLLKLSYACGLSYPVDWDFQPVGSTEELRRHQEAVVRAEEMLAELRGS